jgi:hypothetical protein
MEGASDRGFDLHRGLSVFAPGGIFGCPPMTPLPLLSRQPSVLHRGDAAVGKLEGIVGQELNLVVAEEENESLGDVPGDFDVGQVIAPDQFRVATNLKVVLVDFENHPDTRGLVTRGTD